MAANEAMFRDANEVIRSKAGDLELGGGDRAPFLCECADTGCTEVILLTIDDYEAVRADPHTFAIVRGHEAMASETVVRRIGRERDGFAVVEKNAPGQEITELTDPRR